MKTVSLSPKNQDDFVPIPQKKSQKIKHPPACRKSRRGQDVSPTAVPTNLPFAVRDLHNPYWVNRSLVKTVTDRPRQKPGKKPNLKNPAPQVLPVGEKVEERKGSEYDEKFEEENVLTSQYTHLIVPEPQLRQAVGALACKACSQNEKVGNGELSLEIEHVGLASKIKFFCKECETYQSQVLPLESVFHGKKREKSGQRRENSAWYQVNIAAFLGSLSVGLGHSDMQKFLCIMDLPGGHSQFKGWWIVEEDVGPVIRGLLDDVLQDNLDAEIEATLEYGRQTWQSLSQKGKKGRKWVRAAGKKCGIPLSFDQWKALPDNKRPKVPLTVSFDMGWQKRSNGNRYDSASGHAMLVGGHTKRPLALTLFSKICQACEIAQRLGKDPKHWGPCPKHYEGSSKGMEANGALKLVTQLNAHPRKIVVSEIVSDNDSSIRAKLKHSYKEFAEEDGEYEYPTDARGNKLRDVGELPLQYEEPSFLADPTHRTKNVAKAVFAEARKPKKDSKYGVHLMDAHRIKRNWGAAQKQSRVKTFGEFKTAMNAVLSHHFDDHSKCGPWCVRLKTHLESKKTSTKRRKKVSPPDTSFTAPEEATPKPPSKQPKLPPSAKPSGATADEIDLFPDGKFYRNKKKHANTYTFLNNKLSTFLTDERLQELHHPFDSQTNEGLNTLISFYAPKNRTYSSTQSLRNRISLAITIHSRGISGTFQDLFDRLQLQKSNSFLPSLQAREKKSKNLQVYKKKTEVKLRRAQTSIVKIKEETAKAMKHERKGFSYNSGKGIKPLTATTKASKTNKSANVSNGCPLRGCFRNGHATHRSSNCFWHNYYPKHAPKDMPALIDNVFHLVNPSNQPGPLPGLAAILKPPTK